MTDPNNVIERVARAIIDANERREKSATHGMEIVAEAALDACHHAELLEELEAERINCGRLIRALRNLRKLASMYVADAPALRAADEALAKIGGDE